jgi:lambda family phage portal protein
MAFWNFWKRDKKTDLPTVHQRDSYADLLAQAAYMNAVSATGYTNTLTTLGGAIGRLQNLWYGPATSPNKQIKRTLTETRNASRRLFDIEPLCNKYRELIGIFVVGKNGFKLVPNFPDGQAIVDAFTEWSRSVGVFNGASLTDMAQTGIQNIARDGEIFVQFVYDNDGMKLFFREAADCDEVRFNDPSSNLVMGVQYQGYTPIAYHFWNRYADETKLSEPQQKDVVSAADMIHVYLNEEGGFQPRGKPWVTAALTALARLNEFMTAYETLYLLGASAPMTMESSGQDAFSAMQSTLGVQNQAPPNGSPTNPIIQTISIGQSSILELAYGKKLTGTPVNLPAANVRQYVDMLVSLVATGLNINADTLTSDMSKTNYAAAQYGSIKEKLYWENKQAWFARNFMQPIYERWLLWAASTGRIPVDVAEIEQYYDVQWRGPVFIAVDPYKNAAANELNYAMGATTLKDMCEAQGKDWKVELEQHAEEQKYAKELGVVIGPGHYAAPLVTPEQSPLPNPDAADTEANASGDDETNNTDVDVDGDSAPTEQPE